jgi:hypothetical protein
LGWITQGLVEESADSARQCSVLQGRRLLAVDGSVVTEPGALSSTWRLHYMMDIGTLQCTQAQVTPLKQGESLTCFTVQPGDVLIGDRSFANRRGINHVLAHGGDQMLHGVREIRGVSQVLNTLSVMNRFSWHHGTIFDYRGRLNLF